MVGEILREDRRFILCVYEFFGKEDAEDNLMPLLSVWFFRGIKDRRLSCIFIRKIIHPAVQNRRVVLGKDIRSFAKRER